MVKEITKIELTTVCNLCESEVHDNFNVGTIDLCDRCCARIISSLNVPEERVEQWILRIKPKKTTEVPVLDSLDGVTLTVPEKKENVMKNLGDL